MCLFTLPSATVNLGKKKNEEMIKGAFGFYLLQLLLSKNETVCPCGREYVSICVPMCVRTCVCLCMCFFLCVLRYEENLKSTVCQIFSEQFFRLVENDCGESDSLRSVHSTL